jgi:type I restriction-modification system DNA methylase subunit/predicted DNA-binding transcriptional regulator AlpA
VETGTSDDDALVSLADVAEMAGVTRPAVSNWRRRNQEDFPAPVAETGATSLFRLGDVRQWMARHGKRLDVRSVDQLVWSALNPARGVVLPEEAAQAGMILLGYLALAQRIDADMPSTLSAAIADKDTQALSRLLRRLDEHALRLDLSPLFPPRNQPSWSPDSRVFLGQVIALAMEHGTGSTFEALVAAAGRGSRGQGEHTTPVGVTQLITSLAAPIGGVVIDPACGYGTLLLAASQEAVGPLTLVGQDINFEAHHIARLRMFVHGQPASIVHGDTLKVGATPTDMAGADLVVADLPVGMSWYPERADGERMSYGFPPSVSADMAWLQDGISRLGSAGFAIFVLGHGSTVRGGTEAAIRCRLIESRCVHAVVALPPALYPTTSIPAALWIVSKPRRPSEGPLGGGDVLLIDASRLGSRRPGRTELTDSDIAAVVRCFRAWRDRGEISHETGVRAAAVSVASLLAGGGNLNPARWIQDLPNDPDQQLKRMANAERDLRMASAALSHARFTVPSLEAVLVGEKQEASWPVRKITDLATIIRTQRIHPDLVGTGATPLIRPSDVDPGMPITPSSRINPALVKGSVEVTKPGDVVVMVDGPKPRAAVDHHGGAVVLGPLCVVRPRPDSVNPVVLAALITSIAPKYDIGTVIGHVDLAALEIPCPDPDTDRRLGRTLEVLGDQRREALAAVKAIDELRAALVTGLSSEVIRLMPPQDVEEGQ